MNSINRIIIALGYLLFFSGCISTSQQFELSGTRWILQSMHGQELLKSIPVTLKITERGISGWSGCNLYSSAQYSTQPKNRIEIKEVAHTDMGCYEQAGVMGKEEEYIKTLPKSANYRISGENLIFMDDQGKVLLQYRLLPKFEANPVGLIGKTWQLTEADGMEAYDLETYTLWFEGSTFGGTTSCRDYEGTYQTGEDGTRVTLVKMTTDVECTQITWEAEGIYTTLLGWIDQYNVSENQLELYTVQNDKLIYESVPEK